MSRNQPSSSPHRTRPGRSFTIGTVVRELMSAAVYVGDGRIAVEEVPRPEPGPGEVLVEIAECGICGSDLHMVLERYAQPGAILGHEWSGIVAAAPSGSGWTPGDRVVGNPTPGCGECRPCRRGRPSVCLKRAPANYLGYRGAFTRYMTVAADGLIRIPDSLPTRVAALAEPTAIALHAVRVGGVAPDDRVLVTGAGPVGLLIIAVLRGAGDLRHHRERAVTGPAPAGARRRGQPGDHTRHPGRATHGRTGGGALRRRLRVLGTRQRPGGSPRPARLCRNPGRRRHRVSNRPGSTRTA